MSKKVIDSNSFGFFDGLTKQEINGKFVVGTYRGTGTNQTQSINLGKKPLAVFIFCGDHIGSTNLNDSGLMFEGFPLRLSGSQCGEITDTGFTVTSSYNFYLNDTAATYGYFAVL